MNRLYILEQVWVYSKIEWKIQRVHVYPLPRCTHSNIILVQKGIKNKIKYIKVRLKYNFQDNISAAKILK